MRKQAARALLRLEEMRGAAPALAVAAGGGNLWKRVVRLLAQDPAAAQRPSAWVSGAVVLSVLAVLGAAARIGPSGNGDPAQDPASAFSAAVPAPDAVVRPGKETSASAPDGEPDSQSAAIAGDAAVEEIPVPDHDGDGTDDVGEPNAPPLTADELAAFRNHGVTADYVRSIASLGYERADPDDILALKIHAVAAEDIARMNGLFGKRPLEEHVSFKIHGVDPGAVRRLSALGLGKLSADDALSMRIHGVDAAYVEKLRSGGYAGVTAEDVVSAKIHGVSPEDAADWTRLGYENVSLDDLVGARIHGASPQFASVVRSLGFSDVSLDDLVSFRIHGVTEDFLGELKSLGFSPPSFTPDEAVSFKIHGVTAGFVREIRSLGYADASADDLAELTIHGVSADEIRRANSRAGGRIPLDDLLERHDCGKDAKDEN